MRLLFASGAPFPPEAFAGAESSMAELIRELSGRGHISTVVAGVHGRARRWLKRAEWIAGGRCPAPDWRLGHATVRVHPRDVPEAVRWQLEAARPDLVVTWNASCAEVAWSAKRSRVPALVWVPDVDFSSYLGRLPPVALAGCSPFVAGRLGERTQTPVPVLRSLVRLDAHVPERPREHVTLVSPLPEKGLETVLSVAALLRHRRFVLVDSWRLARRDRWRLRLRLTGLPNVRLQPQVADMRPIYARTALLMVPSTCEDASPRVVLEAQVNGIPVVGSDIGGIPEAMGDGGLVLPPLSAPRLWADAVEAILASPPRQAELVAKGHANAARPELSPRHVTDSFLALAEALIAGREAA